ncbi:MAG TPA: alpha/beta hydrolase [Solirubrobacterales bacterium]|jgi:pimeloyl-ACP methyl ester carboxylesterase|nr:alpha/beta hydrolase [Solirubrobacterales bacterium]
MPKIRVGDNELHYERAGAGEPLLMIQGMSGTHVAWGEPFLGPLRESFDVIAFDNRGIGLSAPIDGPFTIVEMAEDAAGLMDELGVESAHVVGISMGGMIAQELALAHPDRLRSLTLGCSYCGGPGSQLMPQENVEILAAGMMSGNRDKAIRASWEVNLSPAFRADESRYAAFHEMATSVPAAKRTIELQAQAIFGHDTSGRLGEISAPTLIVHGTDDGVLPYPNGELIASLMPAARLERLEDVGHMFWWEQPERSGELIREHALVASSA